MMEIKISIPVGIYSTNYFIFYLKNNKMRIIENCRMSLSNDSSGYTNYLGDSFEVGVYCSPFFNCQNFTIAAFFSLLNDKFTNDEILQFIKDISKNRKLLLIDVNEKYNEKIENLFSKNTIVFKNEYTSTNDSKMTMYYINISNILNENN